MTRSPYGNNSNNNPLPPELLAALNNRRSMQGMWIPREDILGWKAVFRDLSGGVIGNHIYSNKNMGPISSIDVEQDSLGLLMSGSIRLSRPRLPILPEYTFTVLMFLEVKGIGYLPVGEGRVPEASSNNPFEYSLALDPLENMVMDGYATGLPPTHPAFSGSINTLGYVEVEFLSKNSDLVSKLLKEHPTGSIGVDWNRTIILSKPEHQSPVSIGANQFYELNTAGYIIPPYHTEARGDPGPGWKKFTYYGIPRPPFADQRAIDMTNIEFEEVTLARGPDKMWCREYLIQAVRHGEHGTEYGYQYIERNADGDQWEKPLVKDVVSNSYALVTCWDFQSWYENSSLPGSQLEDTKEFEEEYRSDLKAYEMAHDVLTKMENDPNQTPEAVAVQKELTEKLEKKMITSKNVFRLASFSNGVVESMYEPLSAQMLLGFQMPIYSYTEETDQGDGIFILPWSNYTRNSSISNISAVASTTMWISKNPDDKLAVGMNRASGILDFNPDASPLSGTALVHPVESPDTIKIFESGLVEISEMSSDIPFTVGSLRIPEEYFRSNLSPALARMLDTAWENSFDPDPPPEDEDPPSEKWDGRWYLYVANWWKAIAVTEFITEN